MANNVFGYFIVMFSYKFCSEEKPLSVMMNMYSMYRRTHNSSGVEQALFNQSSLDAFLVTLALSTAHDIRLTRAQQQINRRLLFSFSFSIVGPQPPMKNTDVALIVKTTELLSFVAYTYP
jgi:hypothetical protein